MRFSVLRNFYIGACVLLFEITIVYSQSTELKSSLQSNIGGKAESGSTILTVSAGGQPSPIGVASNSTISLFSGYVYTLLDSINPPPAITHTPSASAPANQDIEITATIQDDSVYFST